MGNENSSNCPIQQVEVKEAPVTLNKNDSPTRNTDIPHEKKTVGNDLFGNP
jgi:hypothetical protein